MKTLHERLSGRYRTVLAAAAVTPLLALIAGPVIAASCAVGTGDAVFNVFEDGKVGIPGYSTSGGTCNVVFSGGTSINVPIGNFYEPSASNSNEHDCGVEPTDVTLEHAALPTFPAAVSLFNVEYSTSNELKLAGLTYSSCEKNGSKLWTLSGANCNNGSSVTEVGGVVLPTSAGDGNPVYVTNKLGFNVYSNIKTQNGRTVIFDNVSSSTPFIIDTLSLNGCNGATTYFEAGDYYIRNFSIQAGCNIDVLGSGTVNLYIKSSSSGMTWNGGRTCINYNNCTSNTPPLTGQNPEQLAIWIYYGNLEVQNNMHIAASVYVDDGDFIINSGPITFVGEALAENIKVQNNTDSRFHYQDTGKFDSLFESTGSTTREGEYSLAPAAVPGIAVAGDYSFIPSQTELPLYGGHLKAYAFTSDATTGTTPAWDADDEMNYSERSARLYTTSSSGNLIYFSVIDNNALDVDSVTATLLRGAVLAGPGSTYPSSWETVIGLPNYTQPQIFKDAVMFSASDGFLYSANRSDGDLRWGYMPRVIASGLSDYESFLQDDPMNGQLSYLAATGRAQDDSADDAVNPKNGYVFGTAAGGALHYGLELDTDGSLKDVVWEDARQSSNSTATEYSELTASSPNSEAPVIFSDKVLYVVNNRVVVRPYAGGNTNNDAAPNLNGAVISSSPLVSATNRDVVEDTLYVGDSKGYVWTASFASNGKPGTFTKIHADTIGSADAVTYLSITQLDDYEYLVAQSSTRVTAFKRLLDSTTSTWSKAWTSSISGATEWVDGSPVSSSATTASTTQVQALPSGAEITDKSRVAGGIVFVPITIADASTCDATAYLYLFNLDNGHFPPGTLYSAYYNGTALLDNLAVGGGRALRPEIMIFDGKLYVQGQSETNFGGAGGLDNAIELRANKATAGRRGWREIIED